MSFRHPSLKTVALSLVGLTVFLLLFSWLALPRILQAQAIKFFAEKGSHVLTLDPPKFNPFELRLEITHFALGDPLGKPLLAFGALTVDLSAMSIIRRGVVFDGIRLEEPEATIVLQSDGRLNWSPLLDALKSREDKPDTGLPRFDIEHFTLLGGKVNFSDLKSDFATRAESLDLELDNISTLSDDSSPGRYKIDARTAIGAHVVWQGELALNPDASILATGKLGVDALDLTRLAPYLKNALPGGTPAGILGASTDYRASYANGKVDLALEHIGARLAGLRLKVGPRGPDIAVEAIEAKNGHFDLNPHSVSLGQLMLTGSQIQLSAGAPLRFDTLAFEDTQVNLAGRTASLGRIALQGAQIKVLRNAQGRIDLIDAVDVLKTPAKQAPAAVKEQTAKEMAPAWHWQVGEVALTGIEASLQDQTVSPAGDIALQDISIDVKDLGDDFTKSLPMRVVLRVRDGGRLEASGDVVPAVPSVAVKFKLADLALKPAQPWLASFVKLKLVSGKLDIDGAVNYAGADKTKAGPDFKGGFALRELRLTESDSDALFLALKLLGSRDVKLTPSRLDIGTLLLNGLDTKLIIDQDKSINVSQILRKPAAAATKPAVAAVAAVASPATLEPPAMSAERGRAAVAPVPFVANLDRLRIRNSELDFADHSLALPFGTRIHHLRGSINGLSTQPRLGASGQIELDGQVDDYGLARAVGQVDLFNPTNFTDIKVIFRNVEMNRLTPYAATFAGRKIESGKLSLDLEYKVKQRQMTGDNKVVMDRIKLGERVDSPSAKSLPLDLAIAILQDADGRIDLGLPVSGSLDDPQFSYGGIIWKAIFNVLTKIATAPFRALGALFGGGEKLENIAFDAGAGRLTPPEREKLQRLAEALNKRPGLALTLHGVYADIDRAALQDRQARLAVARLAGQQDAKDDSDPGPLSTGNPKVQAALEKRYVERIGSDELDTLKAAFRQANPGQLEENLGGRVLSRLTGLIREKRVLSENEVAQLAQLKGTDFYATLFEKLRARETVADEYLLALAKARGEYTRTALIAAGAPADRLMLGTSEKVEATGRDVTLKLVLGAATKNDAIQPPAVTPVQ